MQMMVKSKVKAELQTQRYTCFVNTNIGRERKQMEVNGTGNTPYEIQNIAQLNCLELGNTDVQEICF